MTDTNLDTESDARTLDTESDARPDPDTPRVLVPVTILEGGTVPPGVVDLLTDVHTVLLGYHELPEQTAPGQARMQFGERAEELLEDIADQFREAGGSVESRLVFTNDYEKTVDRVARETGCGATLVVQPAPEIDHVYVALGDPDEAEPVDRVARETGCGATLVVQPAPEIDHVYVALGDPDEAEPVGRVLAGVLTGVDADVSVRYFLDAGDSATADQTLDAIADRLAAAGIDRDRVDGATRDGPKTVGNIVEDATDIDVVVIADPDLSLGEFVFGDVEERIAGQLLAPVLVVRKHPPEPETERDAAETDGED